ncbi:MAG: xanthine dehydrogenase family protein subunit M [Desulfobacterota bacterium]|nr:xanthine dehydrogenase family protein subunit M [Thermodesulfobacteriota bacterium]
MRLRPFEFFHPLSLQEGLDLLDRYGEEAQPIAGGTDLIVQMKQRLIRPPRLVNLLSLSELRKIEKTDQGLRIGALTRHAEIEGSALVREGWSLLARSCHKVGSPQIRHLGTVGGNLCNASPAADTAPALLVLGAEVSLSSKKGERRIPLEAFFKGPGQTVLREGELLKEVIVPGPPEGSRFSYLKLGRRKSMDLALVSVAVLLTLGGGDQRFEKVRIGLGSVGPTPIRAREAEKVIEGGPVKEEAIREAAEVASRHCEPITDIRASAEYRREMVKVLVARAIQDCLGLPIPPTGI